MGKERIGDKVEVTWEDALGDSLAEKEDIENMRPQDLLAITKTYGILYKEDEKAVIILQEDSDTRVDYAVIPKGIIVKIRKLK
jgi:hypothetical protein